MKQLHLLSLFLIPILCIGQITGYQHQEIHGYSIYIEEDALNNHPQLTADAIDMLTEKLFEINNFGLKAEILNELQLVKIFVDWDTTNGAAVYHPSLQWLINNGYIEEKWKSVEISNITNFIDWTELNQPFMVMHELAHAYHHRVLSYSYPPIILAYNSAMQNNLYDWVSYHAGNGIYFNREAYAATNEKEYFSELTEAYLGENDFFPFIREELELHDPIGYDLVSNIWEFENIMDVHENAKQSVIVYPNPTNGLVQFTWTHHPYPKQIRIISLDGRIMKNFHFDDIDNFSIDISELSAGMYILVIDDAIIRKILKID